jgi:hypothetical protein
LSSRSVDLIRPYVDGVGARRIPKETSQFSLTGFLTGASKKDGPSVALSALGHTAPSTPPPALSPAAGKRKGGAAGPLRAGHDDEIDLLEGFFDFNAFLEDAAPAIASLQLRYDILAGSSDSGSDSDNDSAPAPAPAAIGALPVAAAQVAAPTQRLSGAAAWALSPETAEDTDRVDDDEDDGLDDLMDLL